jgi:hypothetical protein
MLDNIALIVQIIGFPLALIGLYAAQRDSRRARDLQTMLTLAEAFRYQWESYGRSVVASVEASVAKSDPVDPEVREKLVNLLNWISWFGVLSETRALSQSEVVIKLLGPQLSRILRIGDFIVRQDALVHGPQYWSSLDVVRRML